MKVVTEILYFVTSLINKLNIFSMSNLPRYKYSFRFILLVELKSHRLGYVLDWGYNL